MMLKIKVDGGFFSDFLNERVAEVDVLDPHDFNAGARNVKISFQSSENVSLTLKVGRHCGSENWKKSTI